MKNIHFDKNQLKTSANEILDDIDAEKIRSKSWMWIIGGAVIGFVSSCIKFKRKETKPILAKYGNVVEKEKNRRF